MGKYLHIGERLFREREKTGLSQTDFGLLGGVSRKSQYNYEEGNRPPDAAYLEAISKIEGVDVGYIVTGIKTIGVSTPSGEYRVLTKQQEALLDNLEHCPKEVQDAISKLALAVGRDDTDVHTETQKSA
jgi:transcriptional regulator with XRE-family HTH domain